MSSVAEELLLNTELTEESKSNARNLLNELGLYEYRAASARPVRRAEAALCHRLRHLFRPQDIDTR